MPIQFNQAVQMITQILRDEHPPLDLWVPTTDGPGSFFNSPSRSTLRPPSLLGDDGNLLLSVITAPANGGKIAGSWTRFANDGIRLVASLLHRAAADYGMHRLLVILVLPETLDVAEKLSAEIASSRITSGQFRLVMLPHCDQPNDSFQKDLADHLKLFSPFPKAPFLEPTAAVDLAAYVEEAFIGGSYESNPFRREVEQDVKAFLSTGSWDPGSRPWPTVTRLIEAKLQPVSSKEEE